MRVVVGVFAVASAFATLAPAVDADAAARCVYAAGAKNSALYQSTLTTTRFGGPGSACIGTDVQQACVAAYQGCLDALTSQTEAGPASCERVLHEVRAVPLARWERCPGGPAEFDPIVKTGQ